MAFRALLALVSGVLLSFAFPGFNQAGLVWVWLLPLLPLLWTVKTKRAAWRGFVLGWLAGFGFFAINVSWLNTVSGLAPWALAPYLACFFGLFGAFASTLGNPWREESNPPTRSLRIAFTLGAVWMGAEWLRGWLFTGFGWNGLGVAFHSSPVLSQSADLLGVSGLSFLPVFVQAVVLQAYQSARKRRAEGVISWRPTADVRVALLFVLAVVAYGGWRLITIPKRAADDVEILLVQRNIPQDIKWEPESADEIYEGYAAATDEGLAAVEAANEQAVKAALKQGGQVHLKKPDLVIWPESALAQPIWFTGERELVPNQLNGDYLENRVFAGKKFTLIYGTNEFEAEPGPEGSFLRKEKDARLYNSIAVTPGEFAKTTTYRKLHLVPFGEYIPLRKELPFLESIFKFSSGQDFGGNFASGGVTEPLQVSVGDHKIGVIPAVCFEDTVGRLMRRFTRNGPQMLVNVTNDGWFKQSIAAEQQMANARFRAIELRRPMARAANTGVTCLLDATGRYADNGLAPGKPAAIRDANGSPFIAGTLFGTLKVPKQAAPTLYAALGDVPLLVICAIGLSAGFLNRRKNEE